MPGETKVTVESTYRNPIPIRDLMSFAYTAERTLQDATVRVYQQPETENLSDPGGAVTLKATGTPKQYRQQGVLR
ncbi:hypothetical protein [Kocuria rhizophila]|uniref:hypothetical protein n=1 Tax=Kocuria rhizophila TaxID=72000 RepID=UPI0003663613|nr:hypothetical protein [Kocuria rhizophila]